jgi:hypothetical protein
MDILAGDLSLPISIERLPDAGKWDTQETELQPGGRVMQKSVVLLSALVAFVMLIQFVACGTASGGSNTSTGSVSDQATQPVPVTSGAWCGVLTVASNNGGNIVDIPCNGMHLTEFTCPTGFTFVATGSSQGNTTSLSTYACVQSPTNP